jgi:demethylmenaquinone methyltransferase/2-methoxy-6-polyprenyl-1,4-benzoquinol methylase
MERVKQLPPHPPLTSYYGAASNRSHYVIDLFDRSAPHYNEIEGVFFHTGLWFRRASLRSAGVGRGMKVLDVAIGTASVARGAVELVGSEGQVFGVDPSAGMLRQARRVFHGPVTRGVAENLPFADDTFDFLTMGIALRHVSDLGMTFAEYLRVLKPGGNLWVLDSHVPSSRWGRALARLVWARLVPAMTLLFTRSQDAKLLMDYYWDTVEQCVPPAAIVSAITEVGFEEPRCTVTVPGAFCTYTGRKAKRREPTAGS